jgi:hypothetical protein
MPELEKRGRVRVRSGALSGKVGTVEALPIGPEARDGSLLESYALVLIDGRQEWVHPDELEPVPKPNPRARRTPVRRVW